MNKCFSVECDNEATTEFCPECLANGGLKPQTLLVIKLDDETSVPKVFYNGEETTHKVNIFFDWETDTELPGGLTYAIEHVVTDEGYPVTNRIERRIKGHAAD